MRITLATIGANTAKHFRPNATSWAMALVNLAVGVVIVISNGALSKVPGAEVYYGALLRIFDARTWQMLFVTVGTLRVAALIVASVIPTIWWMPYFRLSLAWLSFAAWIQIAISITLPGFLTIDDVLYWFIVVLEGYNIVVTSQEAKEGRFA